MIQREFVDDIRGNHHINVTNWIEWYDNIGTAIIEKIALYLDFIEAIHYNSI